MDGALEGR